MTHAIIVTIKYTFYPSENCVPHQHKLNRNIHLKPPVKLYLDKEMKYVNDKTDCVYVRR